MSFTPFLEYFLISLKYRIDTFSKLLIYSHKDIYTIILKEKSWWSTGRDGNEERGIERVRNGKMWKMNR